ncbi:blr4250 [Bradyrhizobium diazoefficiens USDA 110]|uniref:Blr4250 protein n=1 Tax=Bradyrhizobium diazoefficiens (strain JCM 10833 / BCRC 13528 / IAM 13628 / NBRC 14792 / USDA 110) TaxID=224911 RepID=Q89ME3_BRADU|nr:hypothetical protein CO678_15135 [Bradyrhizobium diazoefficiens]QBP23017.1 hypothetical protein Bdiaspc4_22065 [Bradyrhizobium diazoefficiens]BAC49515.1 blr4250 [Bradyrhizobium diazoefficiens USDA 110]
MANLRDGRLGRHAGRRILADDIERALMRMWIGPILHPAVRLALADSAGFVQHGDRPAAQRPDRRWSCLLRHQHRNGSCGDEAFTFLPQSERLAQPAIQDRKSWRFSTCSAGLCKS